ncbi:MAG: hypothetical protein EAZ57_06865 [Cytophagales bacterium]|nr:MAG: hypothetical protein EAZ67_07670 [Cytophagales bacterium]TAF60578.1 MAG: hypothetical protein EAZ57_06865 [Cytophagales bacterium]
MALLALISLLVFSCNNKENDSDLVGYQNNILVLNEGAFGKNTASLNALSSNYDTVASDIFFKANARPTGDVLQSALRNGDLTYLVLNNSATVEVVKSSDFKSVTSFKTPIPNPRYIAKVSENKAYLSAWSDFTGAIQPKLMVLDLKTNSIVKQIECGAGTEFIQALANKVFVGNSFETSIFVYDAANDVKTGTISTAPHSPYQMVLDKSNKLWIICFSFDASFNSPKGALLQIEPTSGTIETNVALDAGSNNIRGRLAIDKAKETIYWLFSDGLYCLKIGETAPRKLVSGDFYGLGVSAQDDILLGAANFANPANNRVLVYRKDGTKLKEVSTGIGPNSFLFP